MQYASDYDATEKGDMVHCSPPPTESIHVRYRCGTALQVKQVVSTNEELFGGRRIVRLGDGRRAKSINDEQRRDAKAGDERRTREGRAFGGRCKVTAKRTTCISAFIEVDQTDRSSQPPPPPPGPSAAALGHAYSIQLEWGLAVWSWMNAPALRDTVYRPERASVCIVGIG